MLIELRSIFRKIPYNFRLFLAVILQGIVSGLSGIVLHYLLEIVESLAFGQSEKHTGFLTDGVSSSRIGLSLIIVGLGSSLVWYFLQKGSKIYSIKAQMKDETAQYKLHFQKQLFHSIWQIIAVGGGAPIGKEAAPREIGTLFAGPVGKICILSMKDRIFLLACGAGAGLAAVYQVPLTSVFFVFETLGIAWLFGRLSKEASSKRIKDKRILLTLPSAFLFLVGLASYFPHLLGNGRMMAQEVLNGSSGKTVLLLFILKALVVLITLWAGAYGGTLTPSFALGIAGAALLGMILGVESQPTTLLLGSVCFLSVTLRAPLSATGLVIGFTGIGLDSLPYLLIIAFLAYDFAKVLDRFPLGSILCKMSKNRVIR